MTVTHLVMINLVRLGLLTLWLLCKYVTHICENMFINCHFVYGALLCYRK